MPDPKFTYTSDGNSIAGPNDNMVNVDNSIMQSMYYGLLSKYPDFAASNFGTTPAVDTPWYKNGDALSGFAGLASALASIAGFGSQKDLLKTQTKGLEQNIAFAKQNQDRRNNNIASFNNYQPSGVVSAFTQVA